MSHYVTLVEVFKHYASVGSAVATGEIDIMEARGTSREYGKRKNRRIQTTKNQFAEPRSPNFALWRFRHAKIEWAVLQRTALRHYFPDIPSLFSTCSCTAPLRIFTGHDLPPSRRIDHFRHFRYYFSSRHSCTTCAASALRSPATSSTSLSARL